MIYLKQESTKFIYPYLLEAKQSKKGIAIIHNSKSEDEIIQVRIITETTLGIKFILEIPDLFRFTMMYQDHYIIVYKCEDQEHYPDQEYQSIREIDLLKSVKPFWSFHPILIQFADALIKAMIESTIKDNNELSYYSMRTVRFLLALFIAENGKVNSWGTDNLMIMDEAILFDVNGHHFKGQLQIKYNAGADLFDLSFFQNSMLVGQRNHIYLDELIDYIDKKVEYVPEYGNN